MKRLSILSLVLSMVASVAMAQIKIGDNPQTLDPSSLLELESNSRVLVISKVSTAQMEAIAPQRGGMVYNTDTECIHYFNGAQWVNLCDAVNLTFTTNNIINNPESPIQTIVITQEGGNYNIEVAPNSIRTEQIADGGINGIDIQNNSIGQDKLRDGAVGADELATGAVTSEAIRSGTIQEQHFETADPFQILSTNEFGNAQWNSADQLFELSFSKADTTLTLIPATGQGSNAVKLDALVGSDDQEIEVFSFDPVNNIITLTLENGGSETINLSNLSNSGTDEQDLGTATLVNEELTINIENGNSTTADLSDFATDVSLTAGLALKEDVSNKSNETALGNSTTLYPTQNAVKTYVDNIVGGVNGTGDITSVDIVVTGGTNATFNDVTLNLAEDGVDATKINADVAGNGLNQNAVTGALEIIPGTAANQILKWNNATTTWELGATENLANTDLTQTEGQNRTYDLNGSNLLFVDNSGLTITGNVGIGNLNGAPQNKLDVAGEIRSRGFSNSNGTPNEPAYSFSNDTDTGMFRGVSGGGNAPVNWLRFATGGTEAITINPNQDVGIGTNFANDPILARLHVDGDIRAEGDILYTGSSTSIPDYVFQTYFNGTSSLNKGYTFKSLSEIEQFVKQNNHLPGVQSAKEIKTQGFWNLGEASRINLEKIEELFLHTIEQEKKIEALQEENLKLSKELEALKTQVETIKKMLSKKE